MTHTLSEMQQHRPQGEARHPRTGRRVRRTAGHRLVGRRTHPARPDGGGAVLGALGATAGAATGTCLIAWLTGAVTAALVTTALLAAAAGVALATAASLVPAVMLTRSPTSVLLQEE